MPAQAEKRKAAAVDPKPSQSQVTLSLTLDAKVQQKAIFLAVFFLFSLFAFILFARANLSFGDVFNFGRIQYNIEKLYSLSFILFAVFYSATLGLATYYGHNLKRNQALLAFAAILLPFIIASFLYQRYVLAFLAFAITAGLTSLFASQVQQLSFGSAWNTIGKALMILTLLAVSFTFVKVAADKDAYFNSFIQGVSTVAPQFQGQVQGAVATSVENIDINTTELASVLSSQLQTGGGTSKQSAALLAAQYYDAFRTVMLNSASWTSDTEKQYAAGKIAKFAGLSQAQKDEVTDAVYAALQQQGSSADLNTQLAQQLAAIWPSFRAKLADQIRTAQPKPVSQEQLSTVVEKLRASPLLAQFYNYFEVMMALLVLSIISFVNFILRILGSAFTVGILKLVS